MTPICQSPGKAQKKKRAATDQVILWGPTLADVSTVRAG